MHCLSSVYSVTTPRHVSGLLAAHHQEVKDNVFSLVVCGTGYTNTQIAINCYGNLNKWNQTAGACNTQGIGDKHINVLSKNVRGEFTCGTP
jgi:hypothetical protein